jgi:hypothetical protein
MAVQSLEKLRKAFQRWRLKKGHIREPVPKALMARAYRAAAVYGPRSVAVAIKIDQTRLSEGINAGMGAKKKAVRQPKSIKVSPSGERGADRAVPFYSRVEMARPSAVQPLAEAETVSGMKLRIFAMTRETVDLLCTLSGSGRVL